MIKFKSVSETDYIDHDGFYYTRVSSAMQMVDDFFLRMSADSLDYYRKRGTIIHRATVLYDRDDLDLDSLHPSVVLPVMAWIKFREETGFKATFIERTVKHQQYKYAGTFDRMGHFRSNRIFSLVEIKSGYYRPSVALQTAGYEEGYRSTFEDSRRLIRRFSVLLQNDGEYRLREHRDPADFNVFLSALNLYRWKVKHGKIKV